MLSLPPIEAGAYTFAQPACLWVSGIEAREAEAQAWAALCQLPCLPPAQTLLDERQAQYCLFFAEQRVELRSPFRGGAGPVFVDFDSPAALYRRQHGGGRGESVARAIGLRSGVGPQRVLDATAGLGGDASVLAAVGCQVQMLERNPWVYALLQDGLLRCQEAGTDAAFSERLSLAYGSLGDKELAADEFDVIYLDPMFPERRKGGQVKKEMQVFHDLVGKDEDAGGLLQVALKQAVKRVVVKRPRRAPWLGDVKPSSSLEGKRCRYDLYPKQALKR